MSTTKSSTTTLLLPFILVVLLFTCQSKSDKRQILSGKSFSDTIINIDSIKQYRLFQSNIITEKGKDYQAVKTTIKKQQDSFRFEYLNTQLENQQLILENAAEFVTENIVNRLIPYWYGTAWDFNGYTDIPGQGVIACGYLVSTVLKHAGFNLNRFKLAQQASLSSIKILQPKGYTKFECQDVHCFIESLKKNGKEGLFVIGLSFHVGFIYYKNGNVFFFHSNYINNEGVVVEIAENSDALAQSSVFYVAEISNNPDLMRKWIMKEEIIVNSQ